MNSSVSIQSIVFTWIRSCGDGSFWGIIITIMYGISIFFTIKHLRAVNKSNTMQPSHILIWQIILIVLIILGINKQLDLQILFTLMGKHIAKNQGWYLHKRLVQRYFSIIIAMGIGVSVIMLGIVLKKIIFSAWIELFGLCLLLSFTIIRMGSINHIGKLIVFENKGIGRIHSLEFFGLFLILYALWQSHKKFVVK